MKRLKQLQEHLRKPNSQNPAASEWPEPPANYESLKIGSVSVPVKPARSLEHIPELDFLYKTQESLEHLQWMMQKFALKQDIFLIGHPGSLRRDLALTLCKWLKREVEYIAINQDTSENELKLRREISGGSAFYTEQAAVRAALKGRVLILDGIEKAERNVLPILNNLLENREMSLEDGRVLMSPRNYDLLMKKEGMTKAKLDDMKIVRVSEDFWVVALGLPVPPYPGHPLDPPLRSRFQSRKVSYPSYDSELKSLAKFNADAEDNIKRCLDVVFALRSLAVDMNIPEFTGWTPVIPLILKSFPELCLGEVVDMIYPFRRLSAVSAEQLEWIEQLFLKQGLTSAHSDRYNFQIEAGALKLKHTASGATRCVDCPFGGYKLSHPNFEYVATLSHDATLLKMLQSHALGFDFVLLGLKGAGKTLLVRKFAYLLQYRIQSMPLYKDMASRDLLQRRTTTPDGDTIWQNSPLVDACLNGNLAVLDGLDAIPASSLTVLQRLISERTIDLPDGTRLVSDKLYRFLKSKGVHMNDLLPVHPSFRLVATGRTADIKWITAETCSMFPILICMDDLSVPVIQEILCHLFLEDNIEDVRINMLLRFLDLMHKQSDAYIKNLAGLLSLRQIIRIVRRLHKFPAQDLFECLKEAVLFQFLPLTAQAAFVQLAKKAGLQIDGFLAGNTNPPTVTNSLLVIGNTGVKIIEPVSEDDLALVPDVVFFDNYRHTIVLEKMLQNFVFGEHMLLIGNQGVGKNKLADRFLQLLRKPRQYIQLHRDTTVQSLTVIPSIIDGVLMYEDSPLVKACLFGHTLVVDEVDKAPTQVTFILKTLVEDGEMLLSDGRRISADDDNADIKLHKDFRMILLANRPGFPFLGNDFFKEIGDAFATFTIDNPDKDSEFQLVRRYAPDMPSDLLQKLITAFTELRLLVEEGQLSYPYSTRELINIAKHLQQYPRDSLTQVLRNVFDFDQWDEPRRKQLEQVFRKHGIMLNGALDFQIQLSQGKQVQISATSSDLIDFKQERALKLEEARIPLRASWKATGERTKHILMRNEMRDRVFSEFLFSFKLPTHGTIVSVCASKNNGTFAAFALSPPSLFICDSLLESAVEFDLMDYFASSGFVKICFVKLPHGQTSRIGVLIFNSESDKLFLVDLERGVFSSYQLSIGFHSDHKAAQVQANMDLAETDGFVYFYRPFHSELVIFDFANQKLLRADGLGLVATIRPRNSGFLWIINTNGELFTCRFEGGSAKVYATTLKVSCFDVFSSSGPFDIVLSGGGDLMISRPIMSEGKPSRLFKLDVSIPSAMLSSVYQLVSKNYLVYFHKRNLQWLNSMETRTLNLQKFKSLDDELMFASLPNDNLFIVTRNGTAYCLQLNTEGNKQQMETFIRMAGQSDDRDILSIGFGVGQGSGSGEGGQGPGKGKPGDFKGARKEDDLSEEHFKYRSEAPNIPKEVADATRLIRQNALQQKLRRVEMDSMAFEKYQNIRSRIAKDIKHLRTILESQEAKKKERQWISRQTSGDVDDRRLVDGITGEKNIYRRRGESGDPGVQPKPKRIFVSFDVSASMSRYNPHDGRLDRSLEVCLLLCEAFSDFQQKFQLRLSGHSGDSADIVFVDEGKLLNSERDQFNMLEKMREHAAHCITGDNTLAALETCIDAVAKGEDYDDYFVILISDANISQYGITASDITRVLQKDIKVNAYIIFIGSLNDQADKLIRDMPNGRAFSCLEAKELPRIIQSIFLEAFIKD